jgi:dTDP-4-dehydrorhamnose 3,5-epimerase
MTRFNVHDTPISGLRVVERQPLADSRGFFVRLFCAEELATAGWLKPIAQINQSFTQNKGVVRGMHFQRRPHSEMKLVTCLRGAVWDVAVDLRPDSVTYLRWHAQEISAANQRAMLIPEGFAHGFQTLSEDCELLYLHSNPYNPSTEDGLNPTDTKLSITWPLIVSELSSRDAQHPMLNPNFKGFNP